ncbi:MAG: hypothetical protein HYX65_05830 [Gemmatimonadetes bacterium]|nr:hypothetical protein [Gemmatimonadota bacterium]
MARAAIAVIVVAAYGAWAAWNVTDDGLTGPLRSSLNAYFELFATNEPVVMALMAAFALATLAVARRSVGASPGDASLDAPSPWPALTPRRTLAVALLVTLSAWLAQRWALHGFALSMDEFNTGFEAAILATGRIFAPVREEWIGFVPAIKPVFVVWRGEDHTWYSGYVPVYAAVRAVLRLVHAEAWLNPLCAGASVALVAAVARRLRPGEAHAPLVAVAALVTSAQFVVTSATQYTMPAHLAANLLWLWLAMRDDRRSWLAAALLGGLALGLHNPFPHALFAAPFFWRWFRRREFARLALTLAVYVAFAALWLAWLRMERGGAPGGGGMLSLFTIPRIEHWRLNGMNLVLTLSWQAPVVALLLPLALLGERRLNDTERDLARGVVLTFLFYVLYGATQGHGWGYRYMYGVLGSLALLAAAATPMLAGAVGGVRARRLLAAGAALSLFVLVPMRLWQAERFVRPFAAASEHLARTDADVLAVETGEVWYGRDLVRNDPALSRPVIVNASMLSGMGWSALHERYGDRLRLVRADELVALGMRRVPPRARAP